MAVIFDLDGLLIDSEPMWQEAETRVFTQLGLEFDTEKAKITTGMRCDKVVEYWFARTPWQGDSLQKVEQDIVDSVCELFLQSGEPMPFAEHALVQAREFGGKVALATSTPHQIMNAVIEKLNWQPYFDALVSAEHLQYPKPHPQVYLDAAKAIGVEPSRCIALEDSLPGMISARSASMKVIAVPAKHIAGMEIATQQFSSLEPVTAELLKQIDQL